MKKVLITVAAVIFITTVWMAFVRKALPPIPEINSHLSKEVDLIFSVESMDYNDIELSLNNKKDGKGMYINFAMSNAFKTGRAGLIVKNIGERPVLKANMKPKEYLEDKKRKENKGKGRDFEEFISDKKGKELSSYTFKQTLVEGKDGNTYMQMLYEGSAMNMIEQLEIPHPITIPAHISRQFTDKGIIQFQKGVYALDTKAGGFYIPVLVR